MTVALETGDINPSSTASKMLAWRSERKYEAL